MLFGFGVEKGSDVHVGTSWEGGVWVGVTRGERAREDRARSKERVGILRTAK